MDISAALKRCFKRIGYTIDDVTFDDEHMTVTGTKRAVCKKRTLITAEFSNGREKTYSVRGYWPVESCESFLKRVSAIRGVMCHQTIDERGTTLTKRYLVRW